MQEDPFTFILKPSLSMETDEFHYFCSQEVRVRSDFAKARSRFRIKDLSVMKKMESPQHEFVLINVRDGEESIDRRFLLERTVEEPQNDHDETLINAFFNHDDCMKVLKAVVLALLDISPNVIAAGAAVVAGPAVLSASSLGSTLIPLATVSLLSPSDDSSPPINEPSSLSLPTKLMDSMTLNLAQILDFFSERHISRHISKSVEKPEKDAHADDRWLAGDKIGSPEYGTAQGARSFEPKYLNLLHMSIIALLVHREYPIYSLFQNNCYWFSNLVYICAKVIDFTIPCTPDSDLPNIEDLDIEDGKVLEDMFYMPFHLYMPSVAGRWMGFKICEVKKIVVRRIVTLFFEELKKIEEVVSLSFFELSHVANLITGWGAKGC